MIPSENPADPFKQGVAHLKRAQSEAAVAGFPEAIHLDPAAPNAYAGGALALRSLEDVTGALQDEQRVRELGGVKSPPDEPLPQSYWDRFDPEVPVVVKAASG